MEYPPEPLVEWTEGTRWDELATGEPRLYAAGVDLAERDRERRAFYTTHAIHSRSDIVRAEGSPERRLLTLEWERSLPTRLFYRILLVPDAPARLRFRDGRTYGRVTDALREAVRPANAAEG